MKARLWILCAAVVALSACGRRAEREAAARERWIACGSEKAGLEVRLDHLRAEERILMDAADRREVDETRMQIRVAQHRITQLEAEMRALKADAAR